MAISRAWTVTTFHVAPKLFLGKNCDSPRIDVWRLGVLLYKMTPGSKPFMGRCFLMLQQRVLRGRIYVPSSMSYECLPILQRLRTVNASDRATLENLMKGQKEELRPYPEPHCENMDPWVTKRMVKMGFEQEISRIQ
ncbi:hypothetical protein mRhiFer1_008693 [Rhinolophus ferrumequinum]|uniref:non-specific serine/threonine protein kinase n=1 Tax=Rhinolophus ferrumequinum TaxID=59479 RepID=A0A7J7TR60_RHIFE|nr:hypothetical protein mRhiFer1_008693 [Rhinolophus ferrumequinum]